MLLQQLADDLSRVLLGAEPIELLEDPLERRFDVTDHAFRVVLALRSRQR